MVGRAVAFEAKEARVLPVTCPFCHEQTFVFGTSTEGSGVCRTANRL